MIIAVSIVDLHLEEGNCHVGTYMFEVDYPGGPHFDLQACVCPVDEEEMARPLLGRLLKKEDIKNPVNGLGEPI